MDVLVVSVGMTPQVVTETLWALFQGNPPFVPAEIHLLTTRLGELRLRGRPLPPEVPFAGRTLPPLCDPRGDGRLAPDDPGRLSELYRRFGHPLPRVFVHLSAERPEDLREEDVNLGFADLCARVLAGIRERRPDARLHVSLAGGRKSQSFYLGYALSLLGRSADVLSHVLVPPARENDPDFWWPEDGGEERVELVGVPFVPLRDFVEPALLAQLSAGRAGFGELVRSVRRAAASDPTLVLVAASREVRVEDVRFTLQPLRFALLWLLAAVARGDLADPVAPRGSLTWWGLIHDPDLVRAFLEVFARCGGDLERNQTLMLLRHGLTDWLTTTPRPARLSLGKGAHKALRRTLEPARAKLRDDLADHLPLPLRARVRIRWQQGALRGPKGGRLSVFRLEGVAPERIVLRDRVEA